MEYTYRIIPVHSALLDSGVLLEGKQAVQIARALQPSISGRLWNDITDYLFGREASQTQDAADALSLFWQSGD